MSFISKGGWNQGYWNYQAQHQTTTSTPTPTTPTPTTPPPTGGLSGSQQSAFDLFLQILGGYGLDIGGDFVDVLKQFVIDGYTPDQIDLIAPELQKTTAWKTRFPGWDARVAAGYNQISVGEYLQLENQYKRIMQENGLPAGFYDDPSDFGAWIGNNVSPDEIRDRVNIAGNAARQVDPTARNLLTKFYGVTAGDLTAYFLDQSRALPTLDRQYKAANVAGWAVRSGLDASSAARYEDLVDKGVTVDQAASAYGTIAQLNKTVGGLAGIYGDSYNQTDAENDVFFGQSEKRRKIVGQEQATFGGNTRGSTGSASRSSY